MKIEAKYMGISEETMTGFCHVIQLFVDGNKAGHLMFELRMEGYLLIHWITVDPPFRGKGLSEELYRVFGELYTKRFKGLEVGRYFDNPYAEYRFRLCVAKGIVPKETLTEHRIERSYGTSCPEKEPSAAYQQKRTTFLRLAKELPKEVSPIS